MQFKTTFGALLVASALAGCASTGNEKLKTETEASVSTKIVEGKSTRKEIRELFGAPLKTTFTDSGLELWTYEFTNVSADAVSYIPIVNSFGSSASGTKKELVLLFDKNGVVQRYSMSESEVKHKSGLFN